MLEVRYPDTALSRFNRGIKMFEKLFDKWLLKKLNPWNCNYRIVRMHFFSYETEKMNTRYVVQIQIKLFPIFWFNLAAYHNFISAYRKMKTLRIVPRTDKHVYTEDECVVELLEDAAK